MFVRKSSLLCSMIITLLVTVFFSIGCEHPANARNSSDTQGQGENIKFLWAFGALVQDGSDRNFEPVTKDRSLKSGDKFKMLVEPHTGCYVYVIYNNSQDDVALLFPYSTEMFSSERGVSKKYLIPENNTWFELDKNIGTETFYLLASDSPLTELEILLTQFQTADAAAKPETAKQILGEIRRIKKERKEMAAPAERPVNLGGAVRGIEKPQKTNLPDIASIAREISAVGFYGKTFTIDHQQ
ncbi:MAG: DUF4384 domain-containing protein [Syntrophobacteraceae bacterium]